jgi:hypothetical protein
VSRQCEAEPKSPGKKLVWDLAWSGGQSRDALNRPFHVVQIAALVPSRPPACQRFCLTRNHMFLGGADLNF